MLRAATLQVVPAGCLPLQPTARLTLLPSSLSPTQGVEIGIGIGVGVSLVVVIYRTAFPRITTLGRLPGTSIFR